MAAYCTQEELVKLGIFADALRTVDPDDQDAAIVAASDEMDGYLGSQYKLPLVTWGNDVRQMCARLAVHTLISARGFNSSSSTDDQITQMREIAERWLKRVSDGSLALTVTDSSGQGVGYVAGGAIVQSNRSRGYQNDDGCGGAFTGRGRH